MYIRRIQIHLMFLFILLILLSDLGGLDSNTSHVLIYHNHVRLKVLMCSNSNTSHVLIYQLNLDWLLKEMKFKYISCSYLSRKYHPKSIYGLLFKYISCSYLSQPRLMNFSIVDSFKYISCSYLS